MAERLARLLGLRFGEVTLQLTFSNGHLRRANIHLGPLSPDDLERIAKAGGILPGLGGDATSESA